LSDNQIVERISREIGHRLSRCIINRIRYSVDFHWSIPRPSQHLTDEQLNALRQFCLDYEGDVFADLIMLPFVFSGESRFCDFPESNRVWTQKGGHRYEALARAKYSLMAWGDIGFDLRSNLVFFEDGNVDSDGYLAVIQRFCEQADSTFGTRNWVFVQNWAACHTSKRVLLTILGRCILIP
jgi:hypothetical protein